MVENDEYFRIQRKLQSQGCLPTDDPEKILPLYRDRDKAEKFIRGLKAVCGKSVRMDEEMKIGRPLFYST